MLGMCSGPRPKARQAVPAGGHVSPPRAHFQIITLLFDPIVKDGAFAAVGRQPFRMLGFWEKPCKWEHSGLGRSVRISHPCGRKPPSGVKPPLKHPRSRCCPPRELVQQQGLGWDARGPTRSPGHWITGYK